MSGLTRSIPGAYETEGLDDSDPSPSSRFEYLEGVRAHLEAAREGLQNLRRTSVLAAPDSNLEAMYAGCVRELEFIGLELAGIGGDRKDQETSSAGNTEANATTQTAGANSYMSSIDIDPLVYQSNPAYSFFVHFFPRGRYADWRDRPSVSSLTDAINAAFQENPSTAHIQRLAHHLSWMPKGTLILTIPPGSMGMEDLVKHIDFVGIVERMAPKQPVEAWSRYLLYGTTSCFLRIHDIPYSDAGLGDWNGVGRLISTHNPGYSLPSSFRITGEAVPVKSPRADGSGGSWDAVVDLTGLDGDTVERLRNACAQEPRFILEMGDWCSIATSTSFLELRD